MQTAQHVFDQFFLTKMHHSRTIVFPKICRDLKLAKAKALLACQCMLEAQATTQLQNVGSRRSACCSQVLEKKVLEKNSVVERCLCHTLCAYLHAASSALSDSSNVLFLYFLQKHRH